MAGKLMHLHTFLHGCPQYLRATPRRHSCAQASCSLAKLGYNTTGIDRQIEEAMQAKGDIAECDFPATEIGQQSFVLKR